MEDQSHHLGATQAQDNAHHKSWFVYQGNQHRGPFSKSEIQWMQSQGEINFERYVWCGGMPEWNRLRNVNLDQSLETVSRNVR